MTDTPITPIETLPITLFDLPVLAARLPDGQIVLSIRDLCAIVGLHRASQMRRIRHDEDLREALYTLHIRTAGGIQAQEFLLLERVPLWITDVNRRKAPQETQQRLRFLKLSIIQHVHNLIADSAGLPTGSSRAIEDLHDLAKYNAAMQGLADRQEALETSQEKARLAWKEHEQRLRAIEERLGKMRSLSPLQKGHIYELVHLWAHARVKHQSLTFDAAVRGCWGAIRSRYHISSYEDLPIDSYDDCVDFIRRSYQKITGQPLTGEQLYFRDLDGEDER